VHVLLLGYLLVLSAILGAGVKSPHLGLLRSIIAVYLLLWASLILTAQALSQVSAINVTSAYVVLSLIIAGGISIGLRAIPLHRGLDFPEFSAQLAPRTARHLAWFLTWTAGAVLICNLLLMYSFLPSNPDSIVYRFPRAYWYFGQGSLMHFTNHAEPRPLYYPFNGTLAYLPLIHFRVGPRSFSAFSLLSWALIALTTYVFARDLGGPRLFATATAWLIALTPNVLLQALSTNDEIIAAAPLLGGLFFLHRWFHGRQLLDALIGTVGVSISAGTKLHIMFYWPLLLMLSVTSLLSYSQLLREGRNWFNVRGISVLVAMILAICIFAFSFIAYNYVSTGRLFANEFSDQILNKPFNWRAALQTNILYAAQMMLTPIADLHLALHGVTRANHYEAFNRLFAPFFTWVDNGPAFTSAFYRFTGINSSSAVAFNEYTVFIGFTWIVAAIAAIWLCGKRTKEHVTWSRLQIAAFPVWFLTFAASTRYIEGVTVYLGYAAIIAAPALIYAFAPIASPWLSQLRWTVLALIAVMHTFLCASILLTSSPRNLVKIKRKAALPISAGLTVDPSVLQEIDRADHGVYSHTIAWGQPHWAFMAYNPQIRQFLARNPGPLPRLPGEPNDPGTAELRYSRHVLMPRVGEPYLHVYSFPQIPAYAHGIPVRISDKSSPGLTWIGNLQFALGPEWVFAAGNRVELRHPGRGGYIVLPFGEASDFGRDPEPVIKFSSIYGLGVDDDLKFKFEIRVDGELTASTDWQSVPNAELKTTGLKSGRGVLTVYVRNDAAGGSIYRTDVILRSTTPLLLLGG
jgi:hypothetical protein